MIDFPSKTCTAGELAGVLELTPRRVQQLAREGVVIRHTRGGYDLGASVTRYIRYLQERGEGRALGDGSAVDQRERLSRIQADRAELDLAERRDEMLRRSAVEAAIAVRLIAARETFEAIPDRLAAALAAEPDPANVHRVLRDALRAALLQRAGLAQIAPH